MIRRPPRSTLTYTLFPYTTLFRSSRHLLDALLHPRLARLPGGAAEAVELDPFALRAEARQHLDVLHRHVELVAALVAHLEEIVDRKSVVSGKSVSVRVDLGGRRIIKKKHATQQA